MSVGDIEDIYELSPLQQGILFHSLYDGDSDVYLNQRSFIIDGPLDEGALVHAWKQAAGAHTVLRTSFHWDGLDKPLQVVHRDVPVVINRHDWCGAGDQHQERFDRLLAEDLAAGFDPAVPPLQRLNLIKFGDLKMQVSIDAVRITERALEVCGMAGYSETGKFSVCHQLRDLYSARLVISNDTLNAVNSELLPSGMPSSDFAGADLWQRAGGAA